MSNTVSGTKLGVSRRATCCGPEGSSRATLPFKSFNGQPEKTTMDPYQLVESCSDWERTYICAFLTFSPPSQNFRSKITYIPAPFDIYKSRSTLSPDSNGHSTIMPQTVAELTIVVSALYAVYLFLKISISSRSSLKPEGKWRDTAIGSSPQTWRRPDGLTRRSWQPGCAKSSPSSGGRTSGSDWRRSWSSRCEQSTTT